MCKINLDFFQFLIMLGTKWRGIFSFPYVNYYCHSSREAQLQQLGWLTSGLHTTCFPEGALSLVWWQGFADCSRRPICPEVTLCSPYGVLFMSGKDSTSIQDEVLCKLRLRIEGLRAFVWGRLWVRDKGLFPFLT